MRKRSLFEKDYFTGYFPRSVGSFSPRDLLRNERWFWGWLKYLNRYVDLEQGGGRRVLEIGCAKVIFERQGLTSVKTQQVSFLPFLYRYHRFFSYPLPLGISLYPIVSTVFIVGYKR